MRLGFTINEWLALPWWQRRLYVEQLVEEADEREAGSPGGASDPLEAIYGGTLDDVSGYGYNTN